MRIFDNVTESSTVSFDVPVFEGYDAETGDLRATSEAAQDMVGVYEAMHGYAMAELGVEQGTVTMEAAGEKGNNIFPFFKYPFLQEVLCQNHCFHLQYFQYLKIYVCYNL